MRFLRTKPLIITVVLALVLVVLLASTSAGAALSQGIGAVTGLFSPVQRVLYDSAEQLVGPSTQPTSIPSLSSPGDSASSIMEYEELVAENERLRAMLDYKESNVNQELKVAQITGKEPGNWFEVFTINIGVQDGVTAGMPVITPNGLVGKIAEASLSSAKVITIIDARSSVSAIMERTRDTGVVKGSIGPDDLTANLTMNYLPLDTDIIEGDVVLTSGYDEVYPKGLIIGTVTNSVDQSGGKRVTVEPNVDFRRLEEVMVIVRNTEVSDEASSVIIPSTRDPLTGANFTTQPTQAASSEPYRTQEAMAEPSATGEGEYTAQPSSSQTAERQ